MSEVLNDKSIVVLTQQISNYHVARYRAAVPLFERFTILSLTNDADFSEFLSSDQVGLDVQCLFESRQSYTKALMRNKVDTAVRNALSSLSPDLIAVAGWSFPESVSAIAWAKRHEARLIMMSASQREDASRAWFRELIKGRVVKACDSALVGGPEQAAYINRLGMAADCTFHGYDAVDNQHFAIGADQARANARSERKRYNLPERYLLASARMIPKKNLVRLIRAFGLALSAGNHPVDLVVLGDGPGRAELEATIAELGLFDRVHLPGFKSYSQLPIYYGLAEAFIHVPLAEQWGLVINEAAAAGLLTIVSRSCGATSTLIRQDRSGFIVEPKDTIGIADAIRNVIALSSSERHKFGLAARETVADWGPQRYAQGMSDAANAALHSEPRTLGLSDKILFRLLAQMQIAKVS